MINVWLDNNKFGGHGNLFMSLPYLNFTEEADTYYFALDNLFMKGDESTKKVILNIKQLLSYWCDSVEKLKIGEIFFLAFNYSDEYIGCFRVEALNDDEIIVSYGDTRKFSGSSFSPSQFSDFRIGDADYSVTTDSFKVKKSIFVKDINLSKEKLGLN